MRTISINIPEMSDLDSKELTMMVASQLYEVGKLSLGQAADVAGYSKRTFAELLSKYNVSIFNYPSTELSNDVANA
jgi:predicted HTH domain antitoxin